MDEITKKNKKAYDAHAKDWQAAMDTNFGHKYLEKPAIVQQMPDTLVGKSVLCIGVGSGGELEEIQKKKPSKIVGIDISTGLLNIVKSKFPEVEFLQMDMVQMTFPDRVFDFVYSSLTFHYTKDWDTLLSEVNRVLKNGGELLFSTHHPVYWGKKTPTGNSYTNRRGITLTEHIAILPGNVEITYYNHSNENAIREAVEHAGFRVDFAFTPFVVETPREGFNAADLEAYQKLKLKNASAPLFFIVRAMKIR